MERLAIRELADWYKRHKRKPLLIRGARQVGKSTLVRDFAASQKLELHDVNLETSTRLKPVFESMQIDRIVEEIEFSLGVKLSSTSILFIDEIQAIPSAINALRYFYEERPDITVLAAGSLIEIALAKAKFSMPVGRVEYSNLIPDVQARDLRAALDLLVLAQVVNKVTHTSGSNVALRSEMNPKVFKTYLLDCGLASTLSGIDTLTISQLTADGYFSQGNIAEQFIHQHLRYTLGPLRTPESYYWLREARQGNSEVDFLIHAAGHVVPVEVKAGASGTLKSLMQFLARKDQPFGVRFDANRPSIQKVEQAVNLGGTYETLNSKLVSLPLYAVEQTQRILKSLGQ